MKIVSNVMMEIIAMAMDARSPVRLSARVTTSVLRDSARMAYAFHPLHLQPSPVQTIISAHQDSARMESVFPHLLHHKALEVLVLVFRVHVPIQVLVSLLSVLILVFPIISVLRASVSMVPVPIHHNVLPTISVHRVNV